MDAKASLEEKRKAYLAARKEKKNENNSNGNNNASNSTGPIDRKAAMLNSHGMKLGLKKDVKSSDSCNHLLIEKNELEAFVLDGALRVYYQLFKEQDKEENNQNILTKEATLQLRQIALEIVENIDQQLFKDITYSIHDPSYKSKSDIKIREQRENSRFQNLLRKTSSDTSILSSTSSPQGEENPGNQNIPPSSVIQNFRSLKQDDKEGNKDTEISLSDSTERKDEMEEDKEDVPARGRRALQRNQRPVTRKGSLGGTSQRLANVSGRPKLTKDGVTSLSSEEIPLITFTRSLIDTVQVSQIISENIRDYIKNNPHFFTSVLNHSKSKFEYYSHTVKGPRAANEDEFVVIEHANSLVSSNNSLDFSFIAVYDGHSGKKASQYSRSQLHYNIFNHSDFDHHIQQAIHEGFLMTDQKVSDLQQRDKSNYGTTALSVWIKENKEIYVANVGDCRGYLYRNQTPVEINRPHNLHREDEKERILSLGGGAVPVYGVLRVNGSIAVTRSVGDLHIKHLLIPDPEITSFSIQTSSSSSNVFDENVNINNGNDEYLIIASDGLWDVMDFKEVSEFIKQHSRQTICKLLCEEALIRKSKDNVTVVIVYFNKKTISS